MVEVGVPALSLAGVRRTFGGLSAVDGVDLNVMPGERRAIIGPNGAGKTTLFSLISGEQALTSGRVALFGRDVTRLPPYRRALFLPDSLRRRTVTGAALTDGWLRVRFS